MEKRSRTTTDHHHHHHHHQSYDAGDDTSNKYPIKCFDLILPYLHPVELASISSTCKTLHKISKVINQTRSSDASRGLENFQIPFLNAIDSQPYAYFLYTRTQTLPTGSNTGSKPWGTDPSAGPLSNPSRPDPFLFKVEGAGGCECDTCDVDCSCLNCLDELTRECGPSCQCDSECGNRASQRGVEVKLKVVKDGRKGWCLFAGELICKGKFVCEYAGELLATEEARRRQEVYDELALKGELSPALLVVKEHLPSGNVCIRINVDATRIGNVARFINHSCDGGNLSPLIVRGSGALLPRICFFASRDIQENEELSFSYGDIRVKTKGLQCFCGSSSCYGILPSEIT